MVSESEKHNFEELVSSFLSDRTHTENGIGTYMEKSLHFLLKRFFDPDPAHHEIEYKGFVADIKNDFGITEIQTANIRSLRKKLAVFLEEDAVRVILPVDARRHVVWIDPDTGEARRGAHATAGQNKYKLAAELLYISDLLCSERLSISIVTLETDDFRLLNGRGKEKKIGAKKLDRIPMKLLDMETLSFPEDLLKFIPDGLPEHFTREDFSKKTRLKGRALWGAMKLLEESGTICRVESEGRAYRYSVTDSTIK